MAMMIMLNKREKAIVVSGFVLGILLLILTVIFTEPIQDLFDRSPHSARQVQNEENAPEAFLPPQLSIDQSVEYTKGKVEIVIEEGKSGLAEVYVTSVEGIAVSAFQLEWRVTGEPELESVECAAGFTCATADYTNNRIRLAGVRSLDGEAGSAATRTLVGTLKFRPGAAGTLVLNNSGQELSIVTGTGHQINLLSNKPVSYTL